MCFQISVVMESKLRQVYLELAQVRSKPFERLFARGVKARVTRLRPKIVTAKNR